MSTFTVKIVLQLFNTTTVLVRISIRRILDPLKNKTGFFHFRHLLLNYMTSVEFTIEIN